MSQRFATEHVTTALCWCIPCALAMACTSFASLSEMQTSPGEGADAGVRGSSQRPGVDRTIGQPPGTLVPSMPAPSSGDPVDEGDPIIGGVPTSPVADAGTVAPGELCMGSALRLDGTNFALIPRLIEDDFTIEAWISTTASRSGNSGFYGRAVFDADIPGTGANDDFSAGVLNDGIAFAVGNPDTTVQGTTPVTTGVWTHIAVSRERSTGQLSVVINGVLDSVTVAPNRAALAAPMTISFGGTTLERNFIGLIDEVKIWNVVRQSETIAANLRVRPNATEPGLVGYYSFEDREPMETTDGSALGVAAALTGSPGYEPSSALCPPSID